MMGIKIVATGRCLPEKSVTNDELSKIVDTSDEWISSRTGIKQRYYAEEQTNIQLAVGAAKNAMMKGGLKPEDIGYCIVATFTPDMQTPSVACMVQKELGLSEDAMAFDINAACSGFVYGLKIAAGLVMQDPDKHVLLIGSEKISRYVDFGDRGTCVLFGDGAGAAILKSSQSRFFSVLGSKGSSDALSCKKRERTDGDNVPTIQMDGTEVFKFAVDIIPKSINELLKKAGLVMEDVDYFVCHQANKRIIDSACKTLKGSKEKFFINIDNYGNTSAASIPIALDEMSEAGLLKPGTKTLCVGFGAGFTWGSAILEW